VVLVTLFSSLLALQALEAVQRYSDFLSYRVSSLRCRKKGNIVIIIIIIIYSFDKRLTDRNPDIKHHGK